MRQGMLVELQPTTAKPTKSKDFKVGSMNTLPWGGPGGGVWGLITLGSRVGAKLPLLMRNSALPHSPAAHDRACTQVAMAPLVLAGQSMRAQCGGASCDARMLTCVPASHPLPAPPHLPTCACLCAKLTPYTPSCTLSWHVFPCRHRVLMLLLS